jgi:hypothetical protein
MLKLLGQYALFVLALSPAAADTDPITPKLAFFAPTGRLVILPQSSRSLMPSTRIA